MAAPIELDDYRRLATRLFEAVLRDAAWHDFLADLSATTGGGVSTHILAKDTVRNLHLGDLVHGYDPAWGPPYYQHYHAINPWLLSAKAHPVGRAIYSFEMCPDEIFERSEFYADWVRPQEDAIAGGSIVIAQTPTQVFKLGACIRRRDREQVEDRFVAILNLLADPLAHAWDLSRKIAGDGLLAAAGVVPIASAAILLVDDAGRPRFTNPAAEAELASGARLRLSASGILRLSETGADGHLARLLAALRQGRTGWWRGACGGAEASLSALPGGVAGEGLAGLVLGAGTPCVQVVLTAPETPQGATVLAARLGLTQAEAEVVLALAEGRTPAEIAEARAASPHTVRNQIKAALAKCGVRRQSDLVALALRARG
jgi:DNA-binding CsgD family transcriptional regulator